MGKISGLASYNDKELIRIYHAFCVSMRCLWLCYRGQVSYFGPCGGSENSESQDVLTGSILYKYRFIKITQC